MASLIGAVPEAARRHATPRLFAAAIAALTAFSGIFLGAHVAGGADSYGYVSQARLFVTGQLKVPQPLLNDLPAGVLREALIPLGYRLSRDAATLAPTYAPALPMVMSLLERVGGPHAGYVVMPVLAGLAVWTTYALGRSLIGDLARRWRRGVRCAAMPRLLSSTTWRRARSGAGSPARAWWIRSALRR